MDTLILLDGGHKTLAKGVSVSTLEHDLREFRDGSMGETNAFFYIQTPQHGDNGLALDPEKIVGFVATPGSREQGSAAGE